MMRKIVLASVAALGTVVAYADEGWVTLYNGEDLGGWVQRGGAATYSAEDDAIVGASAPNTPNSFLCTEAHYDDFVLEFEFKGHPELNSGVQIRSNSSERYRDGRVHGYQCELEEENRDRDWFGGIYDEGRRGWLYPDKRDEQQQKRFGEEGKDVWKEGEWNQVRIEARGNRIRTWINGTPRADLRDDMTASGFIGLQVHGVGANADPMKVYWRNIRLKPIQE